MIESMKLTKHDYEMIADILDAHYEDTVELQRDHYLDDDTDYFEQLEYLEELIDKTVYMIGVLSAERNTHNERQTILTIIIKNLCYEYTK